MRWQSLASLDRDPVYDDHDRAMMQAEFDDWLTQMDQLISEFKAYVPNELAKKLDESTESLLPLEEWLLATFNDHKELIADQGGRTMEILHPYLARTFEAASGGKLEMGLDDRLIDFALPVIRFPAPRSFDTTSVATLATAAVHRKQKTMLYDLARKWEEMATSAPASQ